MGNGLNDNLDDLDDKEAEQPVFYIDDKPSCDTIMEDASELVNEISLSNNFERIVDSCSTFRYKCVRNKNLNLRQHDSYDEFIRNVSNVLSFLIKNHSTPEVKKIIVDLSILFPEILIMMQQDQTIDSDALKELSRRYLEDTIKVDHEYDKEVSKGNRIWHVTTRMIGLPIVAFILFLAVSATTSVLFPAFATTLSLSIGSYVGIGAFIGGFGLATGGLGLIIGCVCLALIGIVSAIVGYNQAKKLDYQEHLQGLANEIEEQAQTMDSEIDGYLQESYDETLNTSSAEIVKVLNATQEQNEDLSKLAFKITERLLTKLNASNDVSEMSKLLHLFEKLNDKYCFSYEFEAESKNIVSEFEKFLAKRFPEMYRQYKTCCYDFADVLEETKNACTDAIKLPELIKTDSKTGEFTIEEGYSSFGFDEEDDDDYEATSDSFSEKPKF